MLQSSATVVASIVQHVADHKSTYSMINSNWGAPRIVVLGLGGGGAGRGEWASTQLSDLLMHNSNCCVLGHYLCCLVKVAYIWGIHGACPPPSLTQKDYMMTEVYF